ncbi:MULTISPECIES: MarR family winged helix-turn-helix transcriptional regulator [unclassified Pseudoalteromonas]|uniref:MarR family winged helix-turn-helix transcriptional regulator n=1 Tax=unclassified Pseudoalteromonas TaxID=194690 RepID=UPI000CF6FF02|nr:MULTISPECIES: MarR family transcriptional regulator [unclassified Pseudoalteromonas]
MAFKLDTFIPYLMTLSGAKVSEAFAQVYGGQLTNPQWRIVCHLAQTEKGLTSRQLCDTAMLDKSTASRAINELEQLDWLTVSACAKDKRAKQVRLSEQGRQQFNALIPEALLWQQELLAGFSEQEKALLVDLLRRLELRAADIKKAHQ